MSGRMIAGISLQMSARMTCFVNRLNDCLVGCQGDCMDDCLGDFLDGWPSNGLSDQESDWSQYLDNWPSDVLCDWKADWPDNCVGITT